MQPQLWKLADVGERYQIGWLLYNPALMRSYHQLALMDAPAVVASLCAVFPEAKRWVDIGAGSGAFAAESRRRGQVIQACEHNWFGRRMARHQGVDCRPFDLERDPPARLDGPFDLGYCFEVAEHVPDRLGQRLVEFATRQAPTVVFTAARPGQGGHGHVNEQPPTYWIDRFDRAGLRHDPHVSARLAETFTSRGVQAPWLIDNVMVFRRQTEGGPPSN